MNKSSWDPAPWGPLMLTFLEGELIGKNNKLLIDSIIYRSERMFTELQTLRNCFSARVLMCSKREKRIVPPPQNLGQTIHCVSSTQFQGRPGDPGI